MAYMGYSKYRAKKVEIDGMTFDSKHEAKDWELLKLRIRAGEIRDLERQKSFMLLDGYVNNKGQKIRPITYKCDFYYYDCVQNKWVAQDSKGMKTDVYKIKKKMFEFRYPDIILLET